MPGLRVVGLGMACLDILIRAKCLPTWERGSHLSAIAIEGGGPVATACVASQRLGVPTGFIGTCGSDRLGQIKRQTLEEHHLELSHLQIYPGPENQVVLVTVHETTGERIFSGIGKSAPPLSPASLDHVYITQADYLHLDGYHAEAALEAADWMHAAGKQVMLDGSSTRSRVPTSMQALVHACDILICGSGFGASLTGKSDPSEIGSGIIKMGPQVVVQTEGRQGSYTTTSNGTFHIPAFEVEVVDTTGAGDVFHGAFLCGLVNGWELPIIIQFASAVSALKCMSLGGRQGIPTFEQTRLFLRQHQILLPGG